MSNKEYAVKDYKYDEDANKVENSQEQENVKSGNTFTLSSLILQRYPQLASK